MFGLFKKKSDHDIYLDSGMPLVENFYKYGIYASNDNLLKENSGALIDAYEKMVPLYSTFRNYIAPEIKQNRALTSPSERRDIIYFLMYINAFAFGLQNKRLDEKTLRALVIKEGDEIFTAPDNFLVSSQGFHRKVYKILQEINDDLNPSPLTKFFR
jgi:hypothetical protein